jgi:hypothetical protein
MAIARLASIIGVAIFCVCAGLAGAPRIAIGAELVREGYYWYVPEHEKYMRTEFFSQPSFQSAQVKIAKTQRFQFVTGQRGWALLEFDGGTRAYLHLRILRTLMWDAAASDPWYEFQRASVFPEDPAKIEARLKPSRPEPEATESKAPIWKRYKEGWSVNRGPGAASTGEAGEESTPRAAEKKRSRYPLLPPIVPQPGAESQAGSTETPAEGATR